MEEQDNFFQNHKKEILFLIISVFLFFILIFFLFFYNKSTNKEILNTDSKNNSSIFENLFSFKDKEELSENNDINNNEEINNENNNTLYIERLIKVWDKPVAGYGISKSLSSDNILTFMDSNSGIIYQKDISQPTSTPKQITIPGETYNFSNIYNAYFLNDKNGEVKKVLFQYLDQNKKIKSVLATIPTYFTSPSKLQNIENLPDNIINVSVSDDNTKLLFIVSKQTNINNKKDVFSDWYLIDDVNSHRRQIYTNPLTIWNTLITNNGEIFASEIDTAFETSNFYKLKINDEFNYFNNSLESLYIPHTGASFNLNKNNLIITLNTKSGIKTLLNNSFNINNDFDDSNLKELSFNTISKKCALNNDYAICAVPKEIRNYDAGLPDAWYQGTANFIDNLYYLSFTKNNLGDLFYNLSESAGENFDVIKPKISNKESHIIMINKNNYHLYTLNLQNIFYERGGR